jgi:hypothetical protein
MKITMKHRGSTATKRAYVIFFPFLNENQDHSQIVYHFTSIMCQINLTLTKTFHFLNTENRIYKIIYQKLRGFHPRANYTDRETAA